MNETPIAAPLEAASNDSNVRWEGASKPLPDDALITFFMTARLTPGVVTKIPTR